MKRGLYRIHGIDGRPDDVRVEDDGIEVPIAEHLYRAHGYLPRADDLPWQEDYFAKKPSAADGSSVSDIAKAAREQARQEFLTRFGRP